MRYTSQYVNPDGTTYAILVMREDGWDNSCVY